MIMSLAHDRTAGASLPQAWGACKGKGAARVAAFAPARGLPPGSSWARQPGYCFSRMAVNGSGSGPDAHEARVDKGVGSRRDSRPTHHLSTK